MRTYPITLDATGSAQRIGSGRGFALLPGLPAGSARSSLPGSYPITVLVGEDQRILVVGPHAYYFGGESRRLRVLDGVPGECWVMHTFEQPEEGVRVGGRTRVAVQLTGVPGAPSVAVPTAAPSLGTDGFPMRPGMRRLLTFFGGTLTTANLWVLTAGGVWRQLDDTFDPTGTGTPDYDVRDIAIPATRFYWQAAAANMTHEINVEVEAG